MPGVAVPRGLFRRGGEAVGAGGVPQRLHRLHRVQAAGDRRGAGRAQAHSGAGRRVRERSRPGAQHHQRRLREGP